MEGGVAQGDGFDRGKYEEYQNGDGEDGWDRKKTLNKQSGNNEKPKVVFLIVFPGELSAARESVSTMTPIAAGPIANSTPSLGPCGFAPIANPFSSPSNPTPTGPLGGSPGALNFESPSESVSIGGNNANAFGPRSSGSTGGSPNGQHAQSGGGLDGKDWLSIGIGAAGFYNDVKGNAAHNDFYWKGKTTGKIYTKNPFTSTKVGWKANSFKATGKAFQGAKSLGTKLGVVGLAFTAGDMLVGDGFTTSNVLDATFGAAGFIPGVGWMISGSYFLVNTGVQLYSGKSIGEHLDE